MAFNKRGQASGIVAGIVSITVAAILVVNVFFPQVVDTNTTGWDAGSVTLWSTLQIAGAIGMLILTFRAFGVI